MKARIQQSGSEAYSAAVQCLKDGRLVALPTETVYGLAADARNDDAIAMIYAAKGRPSFNPLITHLLNPDDVSTYAELTPLAERLIAQFWPGPLTLVLQRRSSDLAERASAGLPTLALRCPDAPWRDGLREAGWNAPLVMPSGNLSGHVSPTTAQHVFEDLGEKIDLIIDGGPCETGVESTVLRVDGDQAVLLRQGAIAESELMPFTGPLSYPEPESDLASPGMLARHYAPEASLRLNATECEVDEILIGFGPEYSAPNLSATGDLKEAARNLYQMLRKFDGPDRKLAVAPIPEDGLGAAINDRLRRAARGR
ncbi:MAG: L-threonylcarbamoyladenylate synthase [Pseudomonadota bacterium]